MLLTANYKLKKPEGTDVVNVDDFNGNSDIIDEELFAIAKTLKDFFDKGGKIGGDIILTKGGIYNDRKGSSGFFITPINGVPVVLQTESPKGVTGDLALINNDSELCLRPTGATGGGKIELGSLLLPFKDIFLSGISKNTDGYTKLPNGFILQWGRVTGSIPLSTRYMAGNAKFAIEFPNKCLAMTMTPCYNVTKGSMSWVDCIGASALPWGDNRGSFEFRLRDLNKTVDGEYSFRAFYIAIGY